MFERPAFRGGAEDGCCGTIGELGGQLRCGTSIGLPHADMDEHVRIEITHRAHDPVVFVGVNPVECRTLEATTGRICVDPRQRSHPRFVFEQTGDLGAEFASDATDEYPLPCHDDQR